ncbi:hypothetical protein SCHPADRAFT_1002449 [Schizopora paradoxa]|uniref:BTB domain-containing protein n=1 Tax=Schizopora paradoxa TaxID=27342 RepID=A0A0H2R366_9AGAM|nr:hypothetical protein SCHPADRAFT_1002449 [Schizopora paradoxa]
MAPQTKRPRSSSSSQAETSNKYPRTNPKPTPHDAIWFDDGSIVLATDVHLYRAHKSILAQYFTVFKDMFDMPTGEEGFGDGGSVSAERWDGLLLVRMAGDSDEDVYHLLMTLYDREYHQKDKPTTLPIILALLNLGTKYDIAAIRREVIEHLSIYYPSEYENWFSDYQPPLLKEDQGTPKDANFQLLAAARRCNAGSILPMLFYSCAIEPLDKIFESMNLLDIKDFKNLIDGRENMLARWVSIFGKTVLRPEDKCQSQTCSDARIRMFSHRMYFEVEFPPEIFPLGAYTGALRELGKGEDYKNLCRSCVLKFHSCLPAFMFMFWEALPCIFRLCRWDDLPESIDA